MDKITRRGIIILVLLIVGFMGIGTCLFFIGRHSVSVGRDGIDSGRDAEYGRQMGLATETIRGIDAGLGDVQGNVARIAGLVGADAKDLRELANRLRDIAGEVREMENSLVDLRDRAGSFLDHYGDSCDDEVESNL